MMASAKRDVERGEYLTTILGCGGCHTEGALLGNPTGDWLTGSRIGVAYTTEGAHETPGIIFPANLTPDRATGIGRWSKRDLIRFLRTGMDHYGEQANSVMPWPNYALLKDRDLAAVADYLLSLTPVQYEIPNAIEAGQPINESFVRIGVYLFVPESQTQFQEQSDE
jgi:mono/diheme cytochrome c family protein